MAYATKQDLVDWCGLHGEEELIQLTDPDNAFINDTLLAEKLKQADAWINARLVGIPLPLAAPYPPLIVDIACRVTRWMLWTTGRPEYVEMDMDRAEKMLADIAAGRATLGLNESGTEVQAVTSGPVLRAPTRVFSDDLLEKM